MHPAGKYPESTRQQEQSSPIGNGLKNCRKSMERHLQKAQEVMITMGRGATMTVAATTFVSGHTTNVRVVGVNINL